LFIRKGNTFKVRHTLESLMKVQALSWPFITPFLKYNPSKSGSRAPGARVPIELPMFAEAFYPEEWMAHFRIRMINGVPDRDQIRRALLWQLGGRFTGIDNLPEHIYCLLAAIAMKGAQKRKESDEFLGEVAKCWDFEEGFNVSARVKSLAAEALHNPKIVEPLLDIMNKHAFVTTAMLAALSWARRQGGVLAPAQFVWLRGHDRLLWYPLNNLGRRAFHVEASGAMAHYQART
jgi:intracellular multiplication protein IcmP